MTVSDTAMFRYDSVLTVSDTAMFRYDSVLTISDTAMFRIILPWIYSKRKITLWRKVTSGVAESTYFSEKRQYSARKMETL